MANAAPFTVHTFTATTNDVITEDSAALQFIERHSDKLRFCHSRGRWLHWNGHYWEVNTTCLAYHWARELARQLAENADKKSRVKISSTGFASGVEKFARCDPQVAHTMNDFDRDPWLLGTPGGTVDLKTGELRPGLRDDLISKATAVTPDQRAGPYVGCPLWLKFLKEATDNDGGLIRFLQQFCGYSLTGLTSEHALLFVYGPGGNGKSVFLNIVTKILNDYAVTSAMETFVVSNNDKHPTDLAMLAGARLVTASETEEGRAWAETRIKQLTGSDPISARFMRQDFFTFIPRFKLVVIGNHKPVLHNVDDAAKRRFNIVPFIRKPAKPDRELERKLIAEGPGILQWMIDGCLDWQKASLVRPQVVIDATAEYFSDQDCLSHWLEEACVCDPGNRYRSEASSVLFKSWADFAKAAGVKPGTKATFKDNLTAAGFPSYKGKTGREFFGINLKLKSDLDFNEARPQWAER
jgi:putative DNA primase/helicase